MDIPISQGCVGSLAAQEEGRFESGTPSIGLEAGADCRCSSWDGGVSGWSM